MTYTYEWTDADQSTLCRTDENGNKTFVPVAEGNRDYSAFTTSNAIATAYVEPPAPTPQPTALELLAARIATLEAKVQTLESDHANAMNNMNNSGGY